MMKIKKSTVWWGIAIIGYYCWFQLFYNAVRFGTMFPYSDWKDMLEGVIKNFIPIFILAVTDIFIVFKVAVAFDIRKKICIDLFLSGVVTFAIGCLYVLIRFVLGYVVKFDLSVVDWPGTFLNDIIILLGVELVYYFSMLLRSRSETEMARRQSLQYQYDALKSQINPHFLFNSLNLLYSLVSVDSERAKSFIRELARMYRYVMARHESEKVSVEEEFVFLQSYIAVLEMRYNNKFSIKINGTPQKNSNIIPFTMQLLIENVTKHNIISTSCPMEVSIEIGDDNIVISNPLRPKEAESTTHIGLRYLSQLYEAHGRRFHTEISDNRFVAVVPLLD